MKKSIPIPRAKKVKIKDNMKPERDGVYLMEYVDSDKIRLTFLHN